MVSLFTDNPSCYFDIGETCKWNIESAWTKTSRELSSMSKLYSSQGMISAPAKVKCRKRQLNKNCGNTGGNLRKMYTS